MRNSLSNQAKTLTAIFPQAISGESVDIAGPVIDRLGFESGKLAVNMGTVEGTPTRFGVTFRLQEADTFGGSYTDIDGASIMFSGTPAVLNLQPARYSGEVPVNFNQKMTKRFIKAVAKASFLAGSSPKVYVAATMVLGEASVTPVT